MSAIAVVVPRVGRPPDAVAMDRAVGRMRHYNTAGTRVCVAEGATLAYLRSSPAEGDTQPLRDRETGSWLVADARLDNRDALITCVMPSANQETSDAALILAAYRRWGPDCARHLEGDFAFALWDARRRRLVLGRDVFGLRPLFYACTDTEVAAASTIGGVVAALSRRPGINRRFLREFLSLRYRRGRHETARAGIFRVPESHVVVCEENGPVIRRYYTVGEAPPAPEKTAEASQAAFAELLSRSVANRLRSSSPVAVLLSGGADSAAVACEAARLGAGTDAPGLRSYTAWFQTVSSADERDAAQQVFAFRPSILPSIVQCDDRLGYADIGEDGGYPLDEPEIDPLRGAFLRLMHRARADGCRVLLTGLWADQILTTHAYHQPALLLDLPRSRWAAEAPHFMTHHPGGVAGLMARLVVHLVKARLRAHTDEPNEPVRLQHTRMGVEMLRNLTSRHAIVNRDGFETTAAFAGLEHRAPFLDRALVEFLLAMPAHHGFEGGVTKAVLRRGLAGRVPPPILDRRSSGHFSDVELAGFKREFVRLSTWRAAHRVVDEGLMSASDVAAAWAAVDPNALNSPTSYRVARIVCTQIWLERVDREAQ